MNNITPGSCGLETCGETDRLLKESVESIRPSGIVNIL